jgi:flavin reductase (DIM6/NTAB) family NADH-FMN oxidoreductase RutF
MKQPYEGNVLSPLPIVLVGSSVDGRPNYLVIGYMTPLEFGKQVIFPINRKRYTSRGIMENGTFSVNVPSIDLMDKVKLCGSKSGRDIDKSALFDNFYGELETAPMIRECPLSMECEVIEIVTTRFSHNVVGRVVKSYVDENLLVDGRIDMRGAGLFSWTIGGDLGVYRLGEQIDTFRGD